LVWHSGADRQCGAGGGAEAAQYGCREGRHKGWASAKGLEGQAAQTAPEGPGRALDCEIRQGARAPGRTIPARHCHPFFGYKASSRPDREAISVSIGGTGSSAAASRRLLPPMTGRGRARD